MWVADRWMLEEGRASEGKETFSVTELSIEAEAPD